LLTDQDEISNLYRGPSTDASCQDSVHLAKQFQRRRFLEIDKSETTIACGSHVCKRIGTKCAIFLEDLPLMLPTKFRFIGQNGFRGEVFLEINQSETRIACGGHVSQWNGTKCAFFLEDDLPLMLPTKFQFIWPSSFRGEDF